ncbi:MAG: cytochrome c biogenesis protein CcdA [Spirochaetia bacterium]|nr:cytochrome c biogenesis protein CcdA [Spirochaetia bacterium]
MSRQGDSIKTGLIFALLFPILFLIGFSMPFSVYADGEVVIDYYGEIGCSHCDTFIEKTIPRLEEEHGVSISVNSFDILDPAVYEKCETRLADNGYEFRYFPVVIVGNNIYQGESEIKKYLGRELEYFRKNSVYLPRIAPEAVPDRPKKISLSASGDYKSAAVVYSAGLIDGINPCAFTVLLFFFSYLTLRKKLYADFIKSGVVFILAVFLTYILIGFGFYTLLSEAMDISMVRFAIKIAVTVMTLFFAGASFYDYLLFKKAGRDAGAASTASTSSSASTASKANAESLLKLPDFLARRIHEAVRGRVKKNSALWGVFAAGVIVSVMELACTGQIYLPSIIYMLQKGDTGYGFILLLIYNTGFVLPVIAVFIILAAGYRAERINSFFQSNIHISKALLSMIFMLLAGAVWFL